MNTQNEPDSNIRLPGRLHSGETAHVLGFQLHDIAILVAAGLLNPLGQPAANSPRFFAACEVIELARNVKWLDKATRAITKHWQAKNQKRKITLEPHQSVTN